MWRLFFSREGDPALVKASEGVNYGPVGAELLTVAFDFSKPMHISSTPYVTIGDGAPTTYTPTHLMRFGSWISPTRWQGQFQVDWYTGDGVKRISVENVPGADDGFLAPTDRRFTFEVSILAASGANAQPGWGQVVLSWPPADFSMLAGYRVYRSTVNGGPYDRLENAILTSTSYTDTDVINGMTYYYIVRVVSTDLQELDYTEESISTPNDYTPPSQPIVSHRGTCSPYTDQIHASWSATDPESGISEYQYSIGTSPGGTQVTSWVSVGTSIEITRTGMSLTEGMTYYVNVKAQNGVGAWSAVGSSDGILVSSGCPAVDFAASPRSGDRPLTVQFTDQTIGSAVLRLWDFGDGTTSTLVNPQHAYETTGTFTVTLTATGTVATNVRVQPGYIIVSEPPLVAGFAASPTSGQPPLLAQFTDQSSGAIDTWLWDFGDGVTSTLRNPEHTYTLTGTFTVSLTVSGTGGSDTEVKTDLITVREEFQIYLPLVLRAAGGGDSALASPTPVLSLMRLYRR